MSPYNVQKNGHKGRTMLRGGQTEGRGDHMDTPRAGPSTTVVLEWLSLSASGNYWGPKTKLLMISGVKLLVEKEKQNPEYMYYIRAHNKGSQKNTAYPHQRVKLEEFYDKFLMGYIWKGRAVTNNYGGTTGIPWGHPAHQYVFSLYASHSTNT